jgi:hypothetical protein
MWTVCVTTLHKRMFWPRLNRPYNPNVQPPFYWFQRVIIWVISKTVLCYTYLIGKPLQSKCNTSKRGWLRSTICPLPDSVCFFSCASDIALNQVKTAEWVLRCASLYLSWWYTRNHQIAFARPIINASVFNLEFLINATFCTRTIQSNTHQCMRKTAYVINESVMHWQ